VLIEFNNGCCVANPQPAAAFHKRSHNAFWVFQKTLTAARFPDKKPEKSQAYTPRDLDSFFPSLASPLATHNAVLQSPLARVHAIKWTGKIPAMHRP